MKIITFFLILLILLSCKQKSDHSIKIIKIDTEKSDSVMLSKIALKVERIILESNSSSLITGVNEIVTTRDYIFVNDACRRVLQFNSTGKFIKQIGSQGRGPGEYNTVYSIASDSVNKILYVDTYKQIMCFDFSGNLINVIKQESMPETVTVVGDNLWAVSTSLGNKLEDKKYLNITKLIRYTFQGNPLDTIVVRKVFLPGSAGTINPQSYFITDLGTVQYIYYPVLLPEPLCRDTIYEIRGNQLLPATKLDFGEASKPINGKKQIYFGNIYMTTRYLFAEYSYKSNKILFCCDFSNNEKYYASKGFTDDYFSSGIVRLKPLKLNEGILYFIKDAVDLAGKLEGVTEDSNPVIFIVRLKK